MTLITWFCVIFPVVFYIVVKRWFRKHKNIDFPTGFWRTDGKLYEEFLQGAIMLVGIIISMIIFSLATGNTVLLYGRH